METIEADNASWAEVKVTAITTGGLAVFLIAVFEIARRNPAVAAVFDRRRGTHIKRTPPPLLRNTILEWFFLSNTDRYKNYAQLSHMRDVIRERRRQKSRLKVRLKVKQKKRKNGRKNESWTEDKPQDIYQDRVKTNTEDHTQRRPAKRTHYLTPDVVEFNGRRLPSEIAEYAMAGDLTELQLNEYEQRLLQREAEEEELFRSLREEMITNIAGSSGDTKNDRDEVDLENQINQKINLTLPPRASRLRYLGFQQGKVEMRTTYSPHFSFTSPNRPENSRRMGDKGLSKFFFKNSPEQQSPPTSPLHNPDTSAVDVDMRINHHVNRHLKSTSISEKRPLSSSDRETLRCIGLDYFVMIRFLRFCFDITFYPFLLSLVTLVPTYYTNQYDGINETNEELIINEQTDGYFRFTVNRLEPFSDKLWITWGFAFIFYCFVLRRIWIEWQAFICLRFEFLANGDTDYEEALAAASRPNGFKKRRRAIPKKDDELLHLEQYRNSCIVEYIPVSHRRDQELFQFFDSVFPGQVKRAEILINTPHLSDLISRRQMAIELYENFYAKNNYAKQMYSQRTEGYLHLHDNKSMDCWCRCNKPQKPMDPTMFPTSDSSSLLRKCVGCGLFCREKKVKALPHLSSVIKKLNREVENEYQKIVEEKQGVEDRESPMFHGILDAKYAGAKKYLVGVGMELTCSTGFVEFTTLTAKQSALQCNLTGTTRYMVTKSAPDPRDVAWENATVENNTILIKQVQFDGLLFTGTLFWSVVVSAITSASNLDSISQYLPEILIPEVDTFWYNLIQGYLPVILLELLMILVPIILRLIAMRFIRFKTNSEVDGFVFRWHLAYRVANLIIIIVKSQLLKTLDLLRTNPQAALDTLVTGIAFSSQFFLNNMIVATGTELLLELAQIPKILHHFVLDKYITVEATSKRVLDGLKVPESMEWGETIPPFIFGLLIAIVYSAIVPLVTGVCAAYFYLATKVYTHQSLFVYAQPYEGGGMIMYQLNRSVFVIIYISVIIFSVLFSLKKGQTAGLAFGIVMITITLLVDIKIGRDFVKPSITLALTNARIIDEDNARRQELSRKWQEYRAAKKKKKEAEKAEVEENLIRDSDRKMKYHDEIEQVGNSYMPASLISPKSISPRSTNRSKAPASSPVRRVSLNVSDDAINEMESSMLDSPKKTRKRSVSLVGSKDDNDFYLYRQPQLNKALWETQPRPYWY